MAKAPTSVPGAPATRAQSAVVIRDDDTDPNPVNPQNAAIPGTTDAEAIRASRTLGGNEQGASSAGKDARIRALQSELADLQGDTDLKVEVAAPAAAVIGVGGVLQATEPVGMPKTVRIVLEEVENMPPTGQTFSLNGKAYLIRPGEPVDVPIGILEVIDNAIAAKPIHDPQTMKVIGYRNTHRFPYRVVRNAA